MSQIITVFGATGAQGGGLARAILDQPHGGFRARALTRATIRTRSGLTDPGRLDAALAALVDAGLLAAALPSGAGPGPRTERVVRLVVDAQSERATRLATLARRSAATHAAALDYLAGTGGFAPWADVRRHAGATPRVLADLESAGLVVSGEQSAWHDPLLGRWADTLRGYMEQSHVRPDQIH